MLTEAARLAAERRSEEQAQQLEELARPRWPNRRDVQPVDLAFLTALVEAAGNVVFVLILNSIRRLYLESADRLEAVAAPDLAPLYERAARAIAGGEATRGGQRDREARRRAGTAAAGGDAPA